MRSHPTPHPHRINALQTYRANVQAEASSVASNPDVNPRSAAQNEQLLKWYDEKLQALAPVYDVYTSSATSSASAEAKEQLLRLSQARWANLSNVFDQLESGANALRLPYALGDQISLADIHVIAWLARIVFVSEGASASAASATKKKGLDAVEEQVGRSIGPKVRQYWEAVQLRDSFKHTYKDGLH